ncbi:MAG: hypothetical protein E7414_01070 [Ruminococcaceae bacterium]|nr:hypothetical protein [Oscillospiraceae bacterium]
MKRKINLLIPIFIILVLIYLLRSVLGGHVQVETLYGGSMEDMVNTKGIVIKYETVLSPDASGTLEPSVQENARVSAGQEVAMIYSGTVDSGLKNRLEQINKKIEQIEKNRADLFTFTGDVARLEQKITEQTEELIQKSRSGDLVAVREIQLVIEALCEKKAQISGNGTAGSLVDDLRSQKAEIEGQIGAAQHSIKTPIPGIFSVSTDGFEQVVTPYNMMELTPSTVNDLIAREKEQATEGNNACKIMQNFRYFIALNLPAERLGTLRIDDGAKLRFYDLSADLVQAKVLYISPVQENNATVILEVQQHVESLLKRRFVNLEFVKNRNEGYRVSVKALRTKDNVNGVYVRRDGTPHFIPVTILYNTQDMAIVESADSETPLRLYDEVIVSAGSYEEGSLLQ